MAVYALGDATPQIHPDAFVHPDATVIGNVVIGAESTVWPQTVLRGDYGRIEIGARTSVQDGTVIHAGPGFPTLVGSDCVIGHLVHLEGCILEDGCLVGSGSVVLHHAVVGSRATVAANAVVPNRMAVPEDALAVGVPATLRLGASHPEIIRIAVGEYVDNGRRYRQGLVPVEQPD
ncbi:MAG: gamma carbonic anhydrase family protein [Acidimicrobiales bacterium]|nr:gamma carbonic anhydrase family protein [Acidimicrobiales bacterium]